MRRIYAVIFPVLFFSLIIFQRADAHTVSQDDILDVIFHNNIYHYGGEDVGWLADTLHHTNGTSSSFSFSPSFPEMYKPMVRQAAMGWQGNVYFSESYQSVGMFECNNDPNSCSCAVFCQATTQSNGHFTSWKIILNAAANLNYTIVMHELGHAVGLSDLSSSSNINKLMYGFSNLTATQVTSLDAWGAKVITGQHSSHTWGTKFYRTFSSGNTHRRYCTQCNSWSSQSEEACSYGSGASCSICGQRRP